VAKLLSYCGAIMHHRTMVIGSRFCFRASAAKMNRIGQFGAQSRDFSERKRRRGGVNGD